jgi:hypothetical protein
MGACGLDSSGPEQEQMAGCSEYGNEFAGSLKCGDFFFLLKKLNDTDSWFIPR